MLNEDLLRANSYGRNNRVESLWMWGWAVRVAQLLDGPGGTTHRSLTDIIYMYSSQRSFRTHTCLVMYCSQLCMNTGTNYNAWLTTVSSQEPAKNSFLL